MKCYLCHRYATAFIQKNGFWVYVCPLCGLGMTDLGKPYKTFVEGFYTKGYFTGDVRLSAYENYEDDRGQIQKNFENFFSHIQRFAQGGKFLDVGCALGYGVNLALVKGFDAYGFDPSAYATKKAAALVGKQRITQGTIEDISYKKNSFTVITLFDVFEHLADPRSDLQKLRSFLTHDGIIMIATGDTSTLLPKILKRRWTFYIPPQHLFFFSKKTLTTLLNQVGFEPIEWYRIGKWLSLRYVLHLARTTGESRLGNALYNWIGKSFIGKLPLYVPVGDNMVVIAKKTA